MRTLVRWSESSLSMTTPSPEKAEPSRCMTGSLLGSLLRRGLEIAGIDGLKARLLDAEIFEAALHSDHLGRGFGADIAIGLQANFVDARLLDPADARDRREPLGQSAALGLDFDDITAAEHLATELGHRAHQHDASAAKKRDPIANALHALEQMRGQQNRDALCLKAADDAEKLGSRMRVEAGGGLVEDRDL